MLTQELCCQGGPGSQACVKCWACNSLKQIARGNEASSTALPLLLHNPYMVCAHLPFPATSSWAQGLRTLVVGTKIIDDATYQSWDRRYQEAAASFVDRDERLDALGREIEDGLELIGVTAIEDKLQVHAIRSCS